MTTPSPEGQALRDNTGKPALSQIRFFYTALEKLAAVMSQGRIKYPDTEPGIPNWTLGGKPDAEYLDALDRHVNSFIRGEVYAPDSGNHHLAHAAWNLLALLQNNYPEVPALDPEFDQEAYRASHANE